MRLKPSLYCFSSKKIFTVKWKISLYGKQLINYLILSTFETPSQYLYLTRQAKTDFLLPTASPFSLFV